MRLRQASSICEIEAEIDSLLRDKDNAQVQHSVYISREREGEGGNGIMSMSCYESALPE